MTQPISTDLAWRLRFELGLRLPVNAEYEDPRVKEIAVESDRIYRELMACDARLNNLTRMQGVKDESESY